MRILLILSVILLLMSATLSAQNDFLKLDKKSYDFFIRGDFENLRKTADTMFSKGIDYYYLRMRLGVLSFNKQLYQGSFDNFSKALEFNSSDTLPREYIFYSYLYSGRISDAYLYLRSVPASGKTHLLSSINMPVLSDIFTGSTASGYDIHLYKTNSLYYEAIKSSYSFNAGFESYFAGRFKGTFAITNYRKAERVYSATNNAGKDLNFSQNQVYIRLTGYLFPGWEFSGFSHVAFLKDETSPAQTGMGSSSSLSRTEYDWGMGISKNGWRIRTGVNLSISNFSNSNQIRGEGYLVYLPYGNLNLYFTSGGMYQNDMNWGGTYQINQEAGFRISRSLWIESGIIVGNSFLYARYQGYAMNNSFQIPGTTIYGNIIIMAGSKFSLTLAPFYAINESYTWNLNTYTKTNKLNLSSFGGLIKLAYKKR
jgi:hypothetical protein